MRDNRRQARLDKGKTQKEMADDLGFSESFIRHVEAGRKKPAIEAALRISEYLERPAEYLFADVVRS